MTTDLPRGLRPRGPTWPSGRAGCVSLWRESLERGRESRTRIGGCSNVACAYATGVGRRCRGIAQKRSYGGYRVAAMESSIDDIEFLAGADHRIRVLEELAEGHRDRAHLDAATGAHASNVGRTPGRRGGRRRSDHARVRHGSALALDLSGVTGVPGSLSGVRRPQWRESIRTRPGVVPRGIYRVSPLASPEVHPDEDALAELCAESLPERKLATVDAVLEELEQMSSR